MMIKRIILFLMFVYGGMVSAQEATTTAQNAEPTIQEIVDRLEQENRVSVDKEKLYVFSTIERPPFVFDSGTGPRGFSIDLWDEITSRLSIRSIYKFEDEFSVMLDRVRSGETDGAVANITITAEREREMDFSLPIYNSGLQIVIPSQSDIFSVWKPLRDSRVWQVVAMFLVIWLLALHVLWFSGRKNHVLFRNKYPAGLFDAFSWLTLEQLREDVPHTMGFQFIAIFLRIFSIGSMFLLTAVFTSFITIDHLRSDIVVYQDLFGKEVGVTKDSTSQKFMIQQNIPTKSYGNLESMKRDLEDGKLDAIILDVPVAQYYAKTDGAGRVTLVPSIFKPEQFGVLLNDGSVLRERVNDTILQMQEDGTYQDIYDRWFSQ